MTVGVPEISLDTWGLKYVKKKEVENKSPAETKPDQFMRDDEAALSIPNTRQQDTAGDTTTRRGTTGGKTGEQVHQHQQDKTRLGGQKGETFTTSGSKRGEGATDTPTQAGQALDAKGQIKHGQTHTGSEGRNIATNPATHRGGHKIKPEKQEDRGNSAKPKGSVQSTQSGKDKQPAPKGGTGSSGIQSTQTGADPKTPKAKPTGDIPDKVGRHITDVGTTTSAPTSGGAPKIKAELDLAIIKCKLLKMKTKKKDFIEECRPSRAAYRKDDDEDEKVEKRNVDDEKYSQGKYNRHHSEAGIQSGEITPHPNPVKGKKTEDTKYFSQRGEELGSGKEGKKRFESDSKKSDDIVEKAIELINEAYDEMKSTDFRKLKPTYEGDTKEAKKAKGDYCTHCGSKKDKEPQTESEQVGESLSILEQEEAKNISPPEEEDTKKAEGSTSTGDVGAANFVYSDVHEKKKQDDDYDDEDDDDESEEEDWDHAARNDDGSLPSSLDKYKDPKVL